jgi:hypothetical protein
MSRFAVLSRLDHLSTAYKVPVGLRKSLTAFSPHRVHSVSTVCVRSIHKIGLVLFLLCWVHVHGSWFMVKKARTPDPRRLVFSDIFGYCVYVQPTTADHGNPAVVQSTTFYEEYLVCPASPKLCSEFAHFMFSGYLRDMPPVDRYSANDIPTWGNRGYSASSHGLSTE